MRRDTPTQWEPVLERAGLHSARDLARELEVSPQTATRLLHGEQTSRETIERAATLLGITPEDVRQLREEQSLPAFRLPPEADHLTPRQRAAIVAVVRAMLEKTDAPAKTEAATRAAHVPDARGKTAEEVRDLADGLLPEKPPARRNGDSK